MPNFTQITFLNSSVRNFNSSIGWGTTPSSLSVALVDDPTNNDSFSRPAPGTPVFFATTDFQFGGILQSFSQDRDPNGNPVYNVQIQDPRDLLSGVQLIIQGYTGATYSVPNLYNIYGYLEALSFGYSGRNTNGIEWWKIRNAFLALQNSSPMQLGAYEFTMDLTRLPSLPNYYRIGGEAISLMDFIAEVCDAASHDFFFRLTSDFVITLYTVNRSSQPSLGYINQFIQNQSQLVTGNSGYELRNETTSKFLSGGPKIDLYFRYLNDEFESYDTETIAPYWGVDYNRNIVSPSGEFPTDEHNFILDAITVPVVGIGDTYHTNVRELRAALHSQESWELTLLGDNDDPNSPHFRKATKLGLYSDKGLIFAKTLTPEALSRLTPAEFTSLTRRVVRDTADSILGIHEQNIQTLYDAVNSFASTYYGKKFIVSVADMDLVRDSFTHEILTTYDVADAGYLPEAYVDSAVSVNMMPEDYTFLTQDDGRILPYVKFNNYEDLDFSDLSPEDYRISKDCLFVRCSVESKYEFLDYANASGLRAIITLPGPVYLKTSNEDSKSYTHAFNKALSSISLELKAMTPAAAAVHINKIFSKLGGEFLFDGITGLAIQPDMAVIPLKSNNATYGPWYVVGANGKTEFESDPDLVPWNYGGYTAMNLAANAKVSSAVTNMQIGEFGSIEMPGLPASVLGDELIAGGPLITDINVSIGSDGVKTTYRMQTWTPRFGKVQKQLVDKVQSISLEIQKQRARSRNLNALGRPGSSFFKKREFGFVKRKASSSSMQFIAGEYIPISGQEYNTGKLNIALTPPYNLSTHLGSGYEHKAASTLDTIFCPFTTEPSSTTLPSMGQEAVAGTIGANSLNPYGKNNFNVVTRQYLSEENPNGSGILDPSGYYKGIAIRTPVVLAGWGFDTSNKPVPGSGNEFVDDYANRPMDWKVGPLNVKWNNTSQTWDATGASIFLGIARTTVNHRSSGIIGIYEPTSSGLHTTYNVYAKDHLLPSGSVIYYGKNVMTTIINSDHYIIAAEPNC